VKTTVDAMEFFLLDAVWKFTLPIRYLWLNSRSLSEQLNARVPSTESQPRITAVKSLIDKRLLFLNGNDTSHLNMTCDRAFITTQPPSGWLEITPEGSTVWESISMPSWHRYFEVMDGIEADISDDRQQTFEDATSDTRSVLTVTAANEQRLVEIESYTCARESRYYDSVRTIAGGNKRPWNVSSWRQISSGVWRTLEFDNRKAIPASVETSTANGITIWRRLGFNEHECDAIVTDLDWSINVSDE
jgi:hypothetical protein